MVIVVWGVMLGGCAGAPGQRGPGGMESRFEYVRICMGVRTTITVYALNEGAAATAAAGAFDRIGRLDDAMSDYRPTSELMRLCDRAGAKELPPVVVSAELFEVFMAAQRVSRACGGAFDVTVGPEVKLWRASRASGKLPSEAELAAARGLVGWWDVLLDPAARTVRFAKPGMRLDLGGIAKGYAAQRGVEELRVRGTPRCLVALAGDIAAGDPPRGEVGWRIAVGGEAGDVLLLANAAVSTSGDEEQYVEIGGVRYAHIVDPRTGLGMTVRRRATVVSSRGEWADALGKAGYMLGAEGLRGIIGEFPRTGAVIQEEDGRRVFVDPEGVMRWVEGKGH